MADMYENFCSSSPPPPPPPLPASSRPIPALQSDEISIFLHHLFQTSSSASCMSDKGRQMHNFSSLAPLFSSSSQTTSTAVFSYGDTLPEDPRRSCRSALFSDPDFRARDGTPTAESCAALESSSDLIFSSSGLYFLADGRDSAGNVSSSVGATDSDAITGSVHERNDLDDYDCESEEILEVSDGPSKPIPPRNSSKRSRAAEVHNLSEKRRRSRINEKMKALQKLIPNSNKTDKASMLDEAIEYLKQLQLQVQMLSMRNGLNLHPMYLPGVLETTQLPQTRMSIGEGNGSLHMNMGSGMLPASQCAPAHQTIAIPSLTNISNSETSFGLESSLQAHLGPFQLSTSSKEICREDVLLPRQQLDASRPAGNTTASLPFDTRASDLADSNSLAACMLPKERSQNMLFKNLDGNHILFHHLNGSRTGRSSVPDGTFK